MEWYPHEGPQLEFCKRGEFEVLFGGAAGPGKTDCLIMEATRHVGYSKYRAIIFRRTYPQLQEIIDRCWMWYPKIGGQYKAGEHRWYFPSGATVNLGHMQHETDKYNYQGKEFHFCVHPQTEVLMGDGQYRNIIDVEVGEKVATLHGPQTVTKKYCGIKKRSVRIKVGMFSQIQSKDHRLMHAEPADHDKSGVFRPCGFSLPRGCHSFQQSASQSLQTYQSEQPLPADQCFCLEHIQEPLLSLSDHQSLSASCACTGRKDLETDFLSLCDNNRATERQALSHQPCREHPLPSHDSNGLSSLQHFCGHDGLGGHSCSLPQGCQDRCLSDHNQYDELLLVDEEACQFFLQQQAGAALPIPIDFEGDGPGKIPKHNPHKQRWFHPYTNDVCQSQLLARPSFFSSCDAGLQNLVDIRVEHASHYITRGGFVNSNCGFDELTQFIESQYLYLHSRVRTTETRIPLRIRATTNPGGIGHAWVRNRFVTVTKPQTTHIDPNSGQSRCFIPATVYDNPTLVENDPGYIQRLEALPEVEKMRLLHGNWDSFEGQVFGELSQKTHGCDPFPIPPEWEKLMVFDWGYGRPWGALWFAIDFEGDMYLYRAYYGMVKNESGQYDPNRGARQTNDEICREILDQEREKIGFRVADPACWAPTKQRGSNTVLGPSFVEDASHEGLFFLKADNDRLRGKQQVHMRFRIEEETDSDGVVIGERPHFHAFTSDENGEKGVRRWWDELMSLQESAKNPEDVDTDQPDEGYDCTRYAFMSRPIVPKRIERTPPGSFAAERRRLIRAREYSRRHGISLAAAYARVR